MHLLRHITSLRGLLQALLALAVLVAPVAAHAMEQQSAPTSSHHQQTSASAHCDGASDEGSKPEKVPGKTCCASMCMGIAVAPTAPAADHMVIHADVASSPSIVLIGSPRELATPPPRSA